MHLVLDLRAVPDNLVTARHQPPQALGIGVGQPDLGQIISRSQRRQHAGIDLVGLDVACAIALTCKGLATITRAT
jgi:hypothetical protein